MLRTAGISRQFVELGLQFRAQLNFHTVSVESYRAGVKPMRKQHLSGLRYSCGCTESVWILYPLSRWRSSSFEA
jgi:hypothetical protein